MDLVATTVEAVLMCVASSAYNAGRQLYGGVLAYLQIAWVEKMTETKHDFFFFNHHFFCARIGVKEYHETVDLLLLSVANVKCQLKVH